MFLLYGFYKFSQEADSHDINSFELLFPAIFTSGIFVMNFGQFFISWNTSHLDFYLNKPSGLSSLIKGKMMILLFSVLVMTAFSTPFLFFGSIFLAATIAMGLFNAGVNLHIITLISLTNPLPMDINKDGAFNYDGVGCAQFLMGIPIILLPLAIFSAIRYLTGIWPAIMLTGLIGLIGLILFPYTSQYSINKAERIKYVIGENFRNKKY